MSYSSSRRPEPALWLGLSIGATVLCCLPLGIVGIVYAAKALGAEGRGDYAQTDADVAMARGWTIASALVSLLIVVGFFCIGGGNQRL